MLFFLLLMLLFRSVCHQVSNQADKLVFLAIFFISRHTSHLFIVQMTFIFCFDLKPGEDNLREKMRKKCEEKIRPEIAHLNRWAKRLLIIKNRQKI